MSQERSKPLNQKANYKKYPSPFAALKWGLDIILPPRCPVNGTIVDRIGAISPAAWKDLTFISDPKCRCCGMPFPTTVTDDTSTPDDFLCGQCLATPPAYDHARSVFTYNDGSRAMILAFKHGDKPHLHTTLVPLLLTLGQDFFTPDCILVPVPLHWLRLIKRRYNQAAILTAGLSGLSGHTHWPDALIRTRHTPPQGHKNARDRHQNVAHAFDLNPSYAGKIKDKNIILIDDVFTTGATLEECTKVLKSGGAGSVNILTIARVVKD